MHSAYRPEDWQTFYGAVAGSAAALTGLLFVALSVNLALMRVPAYGARAREAVSALLILVLMAFAVLIPGQGTRALGWELVAGGLLVEAYGIRLQAQTLRNLPRARRGRWAARLAPLHVATLAVPGAGASLLVGRGGGLLWLIPTVLIYITWAVANSWALLVLAAGGTAGDAETDTEDEKARSPTAHPDPGAARPPGGAGAWPRSPSRARPRRPGR